MPPVEKLVASRGKRILSQQYRREQSERMQRGRPDLWGKYRGRQLDQVGEDWRIAKLALDGFSNSEIASEVGLQHGQTIGARLQKIGFENSRKPRVYHHGQIVRVADLRRVSLDLGKTLRQMADDMGLKYKTLKSGASRGRARKPLSTFIGRAFKKRLPKWRNEFRHTAACADGGRPQVLLTSERTNLCVEYNSLLTDAKVILKWLSVRAEHDTPTVFADLREWVYLEARKGRLRRIAFWSELLENLGTLAADDRRILRGSVKASDLARKLLANLYAVSIETVRRASFPRPRFLHSF